MINNIFKENLVSAFCCGACFVDCVVMTLKAKKDLRRFGNVCPYKKAECKKDQNIRNRVSPLCRLCRASSWGSDRFWRSPPVAWPRTTTLRSYPPGNVFSQNWDSTGDDDGANLSYPVAHVDDSAVDKNALAVEWLSYQAEHLGEGALSTLCNIVSPGNNGQIICWLKPQLLC